MRGSGTDLLIRSECDGQWAVRDIFRIQALDHSHDLGDPGLVIGTQNGRAVAGDQGAAF